MVEKNESKEELLKDIQAEKGYSYNVKQSIEDIAKDLSKKDVQKIRDAMKIQKAHVGAPLAHEQLGSAIMDGIDHQAAAHKDIQKYAKDVMNIIDVRRGAVGEYFAHNQFVELNNSHAKEDMDNAQLKREAANGIAAKDNHEVNIEINADHSVQNGIKNILAVYIDKGADEDIKLQQTPNNQAKLNKHING